MQEVCYPELQDGKADSATVTKIGQTVTGRTIGAWALDGDTRGTCAHTLLYNMYQPSKQMEGQTIFSKSGKVTLVIIYIFSSVSYLWLHHLSACRHYFCVQFLSPCSLKCWTKCLY